jgi:uncharacterized protein
VDVSYTITPFLAWLVAGSTKFLINSVKSRQLAFDKIGYGNLPSNHSAIVSSTAALIGLRDGIGTGMFGVAVTLVFIVLMDAASLRLQVGKQAAAINQLAERNRQFEILRTSLGHTRGEILTGVGVGILTAYVVNAVF